eukprot:633244-Pyramimonas_sp.AAC.1
MHAGVYASAPVCSRHKPLLFVAHLVRTRFPLSKSQDGPIGRRTRGYILTTDQSASAVQGWWRSRRWARGSGWGAPGSTHTCCWGRTGRLKSSSRT